MTTTKTSSADLQAQINNIRAQINNSNDWLALGQLYDAAVALQGAHPNNASSLVKEAEAAYDRALADAWDEVETSWDLVSDGAMLD